MLYIHFNLLNERLHVLTEYNTSATPLKDKKIEN